MINTLQKKKKTTTSMQYRKFLSSKIDFLRFKLRQRQLTYCLGCVLDAIIDRS